MFETISQLNWALIAPFLGLDFLLKVIATIAWVRQRRDSTAPWFWLPIILFINLLGPIIYFIFGRREIY